MTAVFYVGDAIETMGKLPEKSVDLILSSPPFLALRSYLPADHESKALEGGSQATPGEYIDWLLDVVEACARVLTPHGSLCLELGDTYSGSNESGWDRTAPEYDRPGRLAATLDGSHTGAARNLKHWPLAKSLSLIPESFRWAMVYGHNPFTGRKTEPWRLRNVIRWVRPNPPVGALGDKFRPATSELMVFCKAKDRYFDLDAVREPNARVDEMPRVGKNSFAREGQGGDWSRGPDSLSIQNPAGAPPLDWWNIPPGGYPGAHYAVWPPELLIKPIKAMCPESVCRTCGEASRRIVETERTTDENWDRPHQLAGKRSAFAGVAGPFASNGETARTTLGFSDCSHNDYRPGVVLDCFAGSGTTLAVATGHGRDAIGIDLDERNFELALDRVGPLILQRGTID